MDADADRVARLAAEILQPIANNLAASPVKHQAPIPTGQREALHALAFAAASVIVSAGDYFCRLEARSFLLQTVDEMVGELLRDPPRPPLLPPASHRRWRR